MSTRRTQPAQLGFDALLAGAERDNVNQQKARECAHLPGTMEEALPFYRALIDKHHAAMLAGDAATAMALREEAHRLGEKLNNFEPGISADDDAPGCVLERETRAPDGTVPLWGQTGTFEIAIGAMRVRIEMDGIFGIASSVYHWIGFAAHVVELDKPFFSETGFYSFVAVGGELEPGFFPDSFTRAVIEATIRRKMKGKLVAIKPEYRRRKERAS